MHRRKGSSENHKSEIMVVPSSGVSRIAWLLVKGMGVEQPQVGAIHALYGAAAAFVPATVKLLHRAVG